VGHGLGLLDLEGRCWEAHLLLEYKLILTP
jgi:hypothetical protein